MCTCTAFSVFYNKIMKMMCIHITNLAYFFTDILNWHILWGKEKYLLNSLYEKLKNKVSLKQM